MIVVSATEKMLALYKGKLQSIDRQILLKSDFLVNAGERHYSQQKIQTFRQHSAVTIMQTKLDV